METLGTDSFNPLPQEVVDLLVTGPVSLACGSRQDECIPGTWVCLTELPRDVLAGSARYTSRGEKCPVIK